MAGLDLSAERSGKSAESVVPDRSPSDCRLDRNHHPAQHCGAAEVSLSEREVFLKGKGYDAEDALGAVEKVSGVCTEGSGTAQTNA
jgi:hypothetical protein